MRQPNWRRWEVILLVNMYYDIEKNNLNISDECRKLSVFLRKSSLDDTLNNINYRNYQGILMNYQNICSVFSGKEFKNYSKLDAEIVRYYNEDNEGFKKELHDILRI